MIVRSMWTEQINHDPAHTLMNTGSIIAGGPSMGSWVLYGLGAEAENLPGIGADVVRQGRADAADRGSPVLPASCRADFRASSSLIGDPVLYINNPEGVDQSAQDETIKAINALTAWK